MKTVDSLIRESCSRHQSRPAIREKVSGRWIATSYSRLWSTSERVASGLQRKGLSAGDKIALLAPSSSRWVTAYLGILATGAIAVPIDKDLKSGELKHILADCGARIIFTTESYLDTLLDLMGDLPELTEIVLIDHNRFPHGGNSEAGEAINSLITEWQQLRKELSLPSERVRRLEEAANRAHYLLSRRGRDKPGSKPVFDIFHSAFRLRQDLIKKRHLLGFEDLCSTDQYTEVPKQSNDPAVILYTSGTTGYSKGAILSHGNLTSNILGAKDHFGLDEKMHTLSFLPINHVFEQVCGILLPLSLGGAISFAESLKKLGENLTEVKPTFFLGVPAVYRAFYDRIMKNIRSRTLSNTLYGIPFTRALVTSKVKTLLGQGTIFISGGAALDPEVAKGFLELGVSIFQGYGITETSPVIAAEAPGNMSLGTVGKTLKGVSVKINDPNAEGVGEILVKGPNVMLGYYNNPAATSEVIKDGWYHTGDLGRIDGHGDLVICGRLKNLIVTPNGKNVYPEEVETELLNSPFIAEAMVYGHKVSTSAEEVYAMIFPNQDAVDDYARENNLYPMAEDQREKLIRSEVLEVGKRLADYKRIKKFTLRESEFPKTTTRKIKRFAVEAQISTSDE